ncbi:hypothetical protein SLA2020_240240 [Shorea laevis]
MESSKCVYFILLLLLPSSDSISFQIPNFALSPNYILYQGDAITSSENVELTNNDFWYRVGWVTYANEVLMWDSNSRKLSDFTCHFSFSIDASSPNAISDGIEFFLAPVGFQIPPNSGGGFLGLFNTTTLDSSSNRIISVEFDTFQNPEWDPEEVQSHVGININSIRSVIYSPWNASFHFKETADVLITYNSTTKNLSVSWGYQNTKNPQENSTLSYLVDLRDVLNEWVTIGISASTGGANGRHTLHSWKFKSSLGAKETNKNLSRKIKIVVVIAVLVIVLLIGTLLAYVIMRQRKRVNKRVQTTNLTSINDDFEMGTRPRRFSFQGLASATNNFSQDRKMGEGGFGAVYRGYLADVDMLIAVKKISKGSKQGKREYVTEVKIISQLRHRNLVQLIGWCHERSEFLLVYEFMSNGSLDSHLFSKRSLLPWHIRYRITLGLASAILYLHEEWEQCVVHRDIKSSNIMLDSSFKVKLGDFGLAKLMDHELGRITTGLAGTFGYLAPEYISTRKASKESDVFSFGVVILEIATGRKCTDQMGGESNLGLVEWVWDLYGKGKLHFGVDERVKRDFDEKQAECLMIVGMWCSHPDSSLRPSIRLAIQVLNFEATMPNLPVKMPVPMYRVATSSVNSREPFISYSSIEVGR